MVETSLVCGVHSSTPYSIFGIKDVLEVKLIRRYSAAERLRSTIKLIAAAQLHKAVSLPVFLSALSAVPNSEKIKMIKNKAFHLFSVLIVAIMTTATVFAFSTIEGVWKHASKPAFIEFNLKTGIASVKEHQTHKENAGLTIIKNIVQSPASDNEWTGEMFNGYEDKYVSVTIKLYDNSISIFDSENNEVLKLLKE